MVHPPPHAAPCKQEKTGPTAKISNGGQKRRAAAASGRKKHANPTMTTLQEDVAASSHNSRQRKSNAGGGGGRSPPGVAIVAACAMACMLCVGGATLAFSSRGWLGGGEELEASRLATTATAEVCLCVLCSVWLCSTF